MLKLHKNLKCDKAVFLDHFKCKQFKAVTLDAQKFHKGFLGHGTAFLSDFYNRYPIGIMWFENSQAGLSF